MRALRLVITLALTGCLPPSASERVTDAARELNLAARFGRMDIALGLTSAELRSGFLQSRAGWGKNVRVVDVELAGLSMPSAERATLEVDYAWARVDESMLRTTRVSQDWRDRGKGFQLVRERRLAGDLGLFGEAVETPPSEPSPDVHFPVKVIH